MLDFFNLIEKLPELLLLSLKVVGKKLQLSPQARQRIGVVEVKLWNGNANAQARNPGCVGTHAIANFVDMGCRSCHGHRYNLRRCPQTMGPID